MADKDLEVRITGHVDPSLRASTDAAKASIAELGAAAETLSISQRSMAAGVLSGEISLESLGRTLKLNSGEYQKIAEVVALVQSKQAGAVVGLEAEAFARDALTERTISGLERTAEYEAATYAKRKAEADDLFNLKTKQAGANFAQDLNTTTGVTGLSGKSAKDSAQVFKEVQAEEVVAAKVAAAEIAAADAAEIAATLAEEKAASLSYKIQKAEEVVAAKTAAKEIADAEAAEIAATLAEERAALLSYKTEQVTKAVAARETAKEIADANAAEVAATLAEEKAALLSYKVEQATKAVIARETAKEIADANAAEVAATLAEERAALLSYKTEQATKVAAAKAAAKEIADADAAAIAATLAEEKAAQLSYKTEKAAEVTIAKEAAAAKAAAERVTSTVPLYAAQQRLAQATAAANAQLAAGTITEEENAAAVAVATNAYDAKIAALLKSGAATKLETGELIANTAAERANTVATLNSRAAYEMTVGVHEVMQNRLSRLPGSMMILGQALAGPEKTTKAMTALMGPLGIALGVTAAAAISFGVAMNQAAKAAEWAEQLKRTADVLGLTTTKLQEFDYVFQSLGIDAKKGEKSLSGLNQVIGQVEAGGTRAKQITKIFKDELNITPEQLRGWGDLGTQIPQVVDALSKMNVQERETAEKRLKVDPEVIQSLIDHKNAIAGLIEQAHQYGVIIPADVIETSAKAADEMRHWKPIIDGELRSAFITLAPLVAGAGQGMAGLARDFADGVRGAVAIGNGIHDLLKTIDDFNTSMDKAIPSLDKLDGLLGAKPPQFIKDAIDDIKNAASAALDPIGHLIHMLQQLGVAERVKDEKKLAAEPKVAPQGPKAKNLLGPTSTTHGPSIVQKWTEQLHEQEIASNDFFKDNTQMELDFWQKKLALTSKNSKDWLAVQEKIYEAQKSLAHQAFDAHLVELERKADKDKEYWDKYRADLQAEADFVLATYKGDKNVKAYQDQLKKIEDAEIAHEKKMREIQQREGARSIAELKNTLETNKSIRDNNAKQAESEVFSKAKNSGNPLAEIHAEMQVATMKRQAAQQDLADMDRERAAVDRLLQADINAAHKGTDAYDAATKKKEQADLEFANKHRLLMNQMVNQDAASAQRIQQAWHAKIDPMVKFTGDEIKGLIDGTKSWGQVLQDIGSQALSAVVGAIEKMVAQWIVSMIIGKTAQAATAESQVLSYAGVAGAAGTASMAGAPFPLDLGAPAFGQAMATTALAYGAMASLDTGTNYVPSDMMANIHEGERIIPKAENAQMMAALTGNTTNSKRGGDFHGDFGVHLHGNADEMDGRKVVRALESAQGHFHKLLKGMHRDGKFAFAGA